jgi:hypothetical protein
MWGLRIHYQDDQVGIKEREVCSSIVGIPAMDEMHHKIIHTCIYQGDAVITPTEISFHALTEILTGCSQ